MDVTEVQKRIDAMPAKMSAKGLRLPDVKVWMSANGDVSVALKRNIGAGNDYRDEKSEYLRGTSIAHLLNEAEAWIENLPSAEETKRDTFLAQLGKVIDLGRDLGQDVGALAAEMKRLASNAITDQRSVQPAE